MDKNILNVGLIGYQFMGKAHSNAYRQANRFFNLPAQVCLKTLCGRNEAGVKKAAEVFGWENYSTNWREVIADPEIDIIDVSTPGISHSEISIAAAEAGKIVLCEKPLANTLAEAQAMYDAVTKAGVKSGIFHNFRKAPALALAKRMIDDGRIGRIFHFRGIYLQDWIVDPEFPLVWRLQKGLAGSGSHGDLNAHIIDLARWLVGPIEEVSGMMETFIKERPLVGEINDRLGASASDQMGTVDVDDASLFLARFESGAVGTFEATRFALGRKNHSCIEINGSKGSIRFNFERMNELEYFNGEDQADAAGFRLIQASDGVHPYSGNYWPAGHIIGYEHTFVNYVVDAVNAICSDQDITPNFRDGLENQKILDAVERSSVTKQWVKVQQASS